MFAAALDAPDGAVLAAGWSDINVTYPTTTGTNEDRAVNWSVGGSRTVTVTAGLSGTLRYRINSGSYAPYSGGFSLAAGDTIGWQMLYAGDENSTVTVFVNGTTLGDFDVIGSGWP